MDDERDRPPQPAWWGALLDLIEDRLAGRADAAARRRGWAVRIVPGTRTYEFRDPRWDRRRPCIDCDGLGRTGAQPCLWCQGTGVVTDDGLLLAGPVWQDEPRRG
jgi:hypothetical protein